MLADPGLEQPESDRAGHTEPHDLGQHPAADAGRDADGGPVSGQEAVSNHKVLRRCLDR